MKLCVKLRQTRYEKARPLNLKHDLKQPLKLIEILTFLQTSVQVPAPAAGVIEELLVPDGGKVEGGVPLFKLRKGGALCHHFPLLY